MVYKYIILTHYIWAILGFRLGHRADAKAYLLELLLYTQPHFWNQ